MKGWLLILFAPVALMYGCSDKPVARLTIDVENAEPQFVMYASAVHLPGADAYVPEMTSENGRVLVDIPESDSILFVRIEFKDAPGQFQALSLFLMPAEKINVSGEMQGNYLDYDIKGSAAFEQWVKHRRKTYIGYEKRLAEIGYDSCDEDTYTDEAQELLSKIDSARLAYIQANPESELSVLYFTSGLGTPHNYELLGGKLKKGRYKPLLDHWMKIERKRGEGSRAVTGCE